MVLRYNYMSVTCTLKKKWERYERKFIQNISVSDSVRQVNVRYPQESGFLVQRRVSNLYSQKKWERYERISIAH